MVPLAVEKCPLTRSRKQNWSIPRTHLHSRAWPIQAVVLQLGLLEFSTTAPQHRYGQPHDALCLRGSGHSQGMHNLPVLCALEHFSCCVRPEESRAKS
jgi:hypothetical protein